MDPGKSVQLPLRHADPSQPSHLRRRASFRIPDKFRDGADADQDVTAPKSKRSRYMNQSFISLIANVGSSASFEPHFTLKDSGQTDGLSDLSPRLSLDEFKRKLGTSGSTVQTEERVPGNATARLSEREARRSVPDLKQHPYMSDTEDSAFKEDMTSSQILTPHVTHPSVAHSGSEISNTAPSARAASPANQEHIRSGSDDEPSPVMSQELQTDKPSIGLLERLSQTFGFEEPEKILAGICLSRMKASCR